MWTRILEVDLSSQKTVVRDEAELCHEAMGGTGLATRLLERECDPGVDPLGPDNPVIFASGPFGNVLPVATKTVALFKSPHTGNLGESHAGGRMAMALYDAGLIGLILKGASAHPVVLEIHEDRVEFLPAGTLWGYSATATERILRGRSWDRPGKRSILRIGPAGERLSTYACATVDTQRHFGRLGLGAVLGSKRVKAVVLGGERRLPVPDKKRFGALYDRLYQAVTTSGEMRKYHDLGTPANVIPLNRIGGLPTRNFSQGWFEGASAISGEAFADKHLSSQIACAHCQCGCIHLASLREQFHAEHGFNTFQVSYDFELIFALGSNLSLSDPADILRLLHRVEKQGWDAMSVGVTLAWATEAFLAGLVGTAQTGGLILKFGDASCYLETLERMARHATPFFADLEKGAAHCASIYGGTDLAICFSGNEGAGYQTGENAFLDWLLGVRHSHLDGAGYSLDQKILTTPMTEEAQARALVAEARLRMTFNSLVICLFARNIYTEEILLEGLDLLWRSCTRADLDAFNADTFKRKYRFKKACGWDPAAQDLPGKLYRVVTSSGIPDRERFRRRVALYLEEAGVT